MLERRAIGRCHALGVKDAQRCALIHRQSFAKGWPLSEFEHLLASSSVIADGIDLSGVVAGFALSRRAAEEAEILTIAVDAAFRGRGLAGALLGFHLARLAQANVAELFLEVDEANAPALALYRRFGFARVGERVGYYTRPDGRRATALVLRCAI